MATVVSGSRPLPGPPPHTVLGRGGNLRAFERDPITYIDTAFRTYGPVTALVHNDPRCVLALGTASNHLLATQPEVFSTTVPPAALPRQSSTMRWLADDVQLCQEVYAIGRHWRSLLADSGYISAYCDTVVDHGEQMVARWGIGRQLDAVYVMRKLTLRCLLKAFFGIDSAQAIDQLSSLLQQWSDAHTSSVLPFAALNGVIERRRAQRLLLQAEATLRAALASHSSRWAQTPNLLSSLQASHTTGSSTADDNVLVGQVTQFMIVTLETLTGALAWTLFLLSQHPRAVTDVQAELARVLDGNKLTAGHVPLNQADLDNHLPLLRRVIRESLRLLPPRSLGIRCTTQPCELFGYSLPPQALVVYSPYLTHRLAPGCIAPARFRPERWLYIEPTPHDFLPFGFTPENIVDEAFVTLQLKLVLATILQRYVLILAPGTRVDHKFSPVLMPKDGLPMIISPVDRPIVRRATHGSITSLVDLG